ncbi:MAG: hypothetical protein AAGF11_31020 [Myxococcota bacterium]
MSISQNSDVGDGRNSLSGTTTAICGHSLLMILCLFLPRLGQAVQDCETCPAKEAESIEELKQSRLEGCFLTEKVPPQSNGPPCEGPTREDLSAVGQSARCVKESSDILKEESNRSWQKMSSRQHDWCVCSADTETILANFVAADHPTPKQPVLEKVLDLYFQALSVTLVGISADEQEYLNNDTLRDYGKLRDQCRSAGLTMEDACIYYTANKGIPTKHSKKKRDKKIRAEIVSHYVFFHNSCNWTSVNTTLTPCANIKEGTENVKAAKLTFSAQRAGLALSYKRNRNAVADIGRAYMQALEAPDGDIDLVEQELKSIVAGAVADETRRVLSELEEAGGDIGIIPDLQGIMSRVAELNEVTDQDPVALLQSAVDVQSKVNEIAAREAVKLVQHTDDRIDRLHDLTARVTGESPPPFDSAKELANFQVKIVDLSKTSRWTPVRAHDLHLTLGRIATLEKQSGDGFEQSQRESLGESRRKLASLAEKPEGLDKALEQWEETLSELELNLGSSEPLDLDLLMKAAESESVVKNALD